MRTIAAASFAFGLVLATPSSGLAQSLRGIEGCFEGGLQMGMCNGFLAGLAGATTVTFGVAMVWSGDRPDEELVAAQILGSLYSLVSGAVLLGAAANADPGNGLRLSGEIVGGIDLGLGIVGVGLTILAVIWGSDDEGEPEEPVPTRWGLTDGVRDGAPNLE